MKSSQDQALATMLIRVASQDGSKAFKAGLDVWSNPYPYHSIAYFNWIRGYVAAHKAATIGPYCEYPRTVYDGTCIWP